MNYDLQQLRVKCPLPVLMTRLGFGKYARNSSPSPFRNDQNASWGIFQGSNGRWMFKDFATNECGDEINFLGHVHKLDSKKHFHRLLKYYDEAANRPAIGKELQVYSSPGIVRKPDTSFLTKGSDEQLKILSELREISLAGLESARLRNVLKFGDLGQYEVFGVVDESGLLAEVRRLDGLEFPGYGSFPAHKSHTLKHSRKNWPLGIIEAAECDIVLVEGLPDFLAMHQFVIEEELSWKVAPVAMLTSSCDIATEALPYFTGKSIRIFPHLDEPGVAAAERWRKQLVGARAKKVDFFNFQAIETAAGSSIKDLCDFNLARGAAGSSTQRLLDNIII